MDLSLMQKVNELKEQGRSVDDIKRELSVQGISPENIDQALAEMGGAVGSESSPTENAAPLQHHEKVIEPEPGFDPDAK